MIGLKETGLSLLIQKGYKILELDTYFTSGPEETRAWTIQKNCTAPKAAGEIHTDFEKGFIRAETVSYEDFVANDGWVNSKTNGKMRLEGKDYSYYQKIYYKLLYLKYLRSLIIQLMNFFCMFFLHE